MSFDPDKWLADTPAPFDPDAWLGKTEEKTEQAPLKAFAQGAVKGLGAIAKGVENVGYQMPPADEFGRPINTEQDADYTRRMTQPAEKKIEEIKSGPAYEWGKALQDAAEEVYPLNDEEKRGFFTKAGEMAGGFLPLVATGPAAPLTIGLQTAGDQLDAEFQRRIDAGESRDAAANAAINRSLADGAVQAVLFEVLPAPLRKLGDKAIDKIARGTLSRFLAGRAAQAGEGAALGAASTAAGNVALEHPITEGAGESAVGLGAMQALMPRGGRAADTGKNIAESPKTLLAQQQQLVEGRRPAQMFPIDAGGKVTNELPLPDGMGRIETERGVFHFNPELTTAKDIQALSAKGRENEVLALGKFSKPEVDARAEQTGEPRVAVTERTADGTEVKTAVGTTGTAEAIAADLKKTQTPGNIVRTEPLDDAVRSRAGSANFVDDLLAQDVQKMRDAHEAQAREALERDARQKELAEKRARFDERVKIARETFADPNATPAQVKGALESMKFYAEDNSLGLSTEQRQTAGRAMASLAQRYEPMKPAATPPPAEPQPARKVAPDPTFKAEVKAGVAATGALDYAKLPDNKLAELADGGDKRAEQALMRRGDMQGATNGGNEFLTALEKVKLPFTDRALGGELKSLMFEEMNTGQRKRYVSTRGQGLDAVAEVLRADHGFSQIKTPADVIDFTQRALRGENILPERGGQAQGQVQFRRAPSPPESSPARTAEQETWWNHFTKIAPGAARDFELRFGSSKQLVEEGRARAEELTGEEEAASLRHKTSAPYRGTVYLFDQALRKNTDAVTRLNLLHEIGHLFYDTLDTTTQRTLRDQWREEIDGKTGPLHDGEGNLRENVALGVEQNLHEWFAERLAHANDAWAKRRTEGNTGTGLIDTLGARFREMLLKMREVLERAFGRANYEDALVSDFRKFLDQGDRWNEAKPSAERAPTGELATASAPFARREDPAVSEARAEVKKLEDELERLREGASQEEAADVETRGADLTAQLTTAKQQLMKAEREAQVSASVRTADTLPRTAEDIEKGVTRVAPLPPVDRRAALLSELQRGRQLAGEGNRTGNDTALAEGTRLTKLARERLDEEFPGWETASQTMPGARPANDSRDQPGSFAGDEPPREPPPTAEGANAGDFEPSPFSGRDDDTMPVRPEKFHEVYGQSAYQPTALAQTWRRITESLKGWRGPIPELPTFSAAAWNKADAFIKEHGPAFYNRLKEFYRVLKGGNDYVQRTAEQQVARVIQPLIEAGGKFEANDYARLQKRQEQVRRLRAENEPVPAGVRAEIAALNSKLESSPYVLFNRLVLALDLHWRQQNLKDSEGNPIRLPAGVNAAELKAELQRLGERIAASPHAELIKRALDEHMAIVKETAEDLKARGLLTAEHISNPYYFPHVTLEVTKGNKIEQRELRPAHVSPGTDAEIRTYLIEPVGSAKAISTDYLQSMYYHLVQVGAHNLRADAVKNYARPYDVRAEVDARAKQLSKERGVPVSWQQAFHEEFEPKGYVQYGTDSRDAFPEVTIDRDALARRLGVMLTSEDLHRQLADLGLKGIKLLPEDLEETLNTAAREVWIVPSRVADALRGISDRGEGGDGVIGAAAQWTLGAWKQWKLFMPQSHIRYEFGNVSADLEKIFSATPRTLTFLPRAAKEVREFWLGGTVSADLQAALKEAVLNTVTAQEMRALERLPQFRAFETTATKLAAEAKAWLSAPLANATRVFGDGALGRVTSVEESMYREAVFRYANFLNNIEKIRAGARPDYAGAYWKNIDAMKDSAPGAGDKAVRQAAQISKSTFGDYGDLSVMGKQTRDKLIPFYSWMEVNFKYHGNLLRNLRDMQRAGEMTRGEAGKRAAMAMGTAAGAFTARAAGGLMLRLALPYVAVYLWNNTGDREDLEKLLSEEDRRRFHVTLGVRKDGNTSLRDGRKIEVLYAPTAFQDVAKWFSGAKFAQAMAGWMAGRTDFPTAFSSWRDQLVPDTLNNLVGGVGPFLKIPYTIVSGKNVFPDVTDQRSIPSYDMRRVILGNMTDDFTADQIERIVNKDYYASKDVGDWMRQLILQVRQRDPEQWAYYDIRDKAQQFRERMTGDKGFGGGNENKSTQLVRNFRRAIYAGDTGNAIKFYLRLLDNGYTAEKFAASVRGQDPLSDLPKENGLRKQFVLQLSPFDREQLQRAYGFYERVGAQHGRERVLFPRAIQGERGAQRFREQPRTELLHRLMENTGALDDEELMRRADAGLRRSLAPR